VRRTARWLDYWWPELVGAVVYMLFIGLFVVGMFLLILTSLGPIDME
jgi:hypothetical protein